MSGRNDVLLWRVQAADLAGVLGQLMFMHQGQAQPSEAKWHPLLPSVVFSTALEGIHIWKPSTL